MKKKIFGVLVLLMTMVSCAGIFSACGASRNDLKLESESQSIELVLGDTENETAEVEVSIVGFGDGISGLVGFEVIGECARVESVTTAADKSRARCVLRAIRSGNSTLRATLYDGGTSLNIPIRVEQKLVSITAKTDSNAYVVKGSGRVVFDAEKLINFNPISTTQRDVYFMVGDEISDGFEASVDDTRDSVEVDAVSVANENIRARFLLRLIDPITDISTKVDDEEKSEVVLAVNSQTKNTSRVEIQMMSKEQEIVCLNGFHTGDDFSIRMTDSRHEGDLHTFAFDISGISGDQAGTYEFKFGIGDEYDYYVSSKIDISTKVIAKNIAIGLETENYSTLRVFNYNSANSRGTSFVFSVLPNNVNVLQSWGTLIYDNSYITIYNSTKNIINSGDKVQSNSTIFVKGNTGALGDTSIKFVVDGVGSVGDEVEAEVPVVVHEGAKEIVGDSSIVLKLSSDGSASDEIYSYAFDVLPSGAYSGDVWIEAKSTIIAIQKEDNSNLLKIKALGTGTTKIVMTLGNGVTKTIDVEVICEMDENSLVLDAPNSSQSEFVGEKDPVVVGRSKPLKRLVIQKSRAYEKAVPLTFTFYPQNASNVEYEYKITKISGEKDVIVENVGNSLVGKNEGKANVEVTVTYDKLVDGKREECKQTFSFEVEVYVAVTNFYFSDTSVTVADLNSVGFYKLNEATKVIKPYFSPLDATNHIIEYTMSWQDETKTSGILENEYMTFNIDTGEITGRLESGATPSPTTITAKLTDYTREYVVSIVVTVEQYELVRNIVVDNIPQSGEITLSAGHPTFQIIAHAEKTTANNRTLVYSFIPNDVSAGVVTVDQNGLVRLDVDKAKSAGLGGKIRIAAQDSFKNDNINADTYRDIDVTVAIGTEDSPYPITTAEELLALNSPEALAKFYKIVGVIDLKGAQISPLGELTGGIVGAKGSKIIGINITGDNGDEDSPCAGLFSKISPSAYIKNVAFSGAINYEGDATNIGLVAGVNNGTIENCWVNITKSEINVSGPCFVGGMFGVNNNKITTTISSGTTNHNLVTFGGQMSVVAQNLDEVFVGGVVGKNAAAGIILREVFGVSLYGTNGYSSIVNLSTINAAATGGIAGQNDGELTSLASSGKIAGGQNVGGFVGQNNGYIKLDDNEDNSARCISNTFVQGDSGVGGFVGKMNGGIISDCGVEIYEQASYLENEKYVAYAKGHVGGFVGIAYAGNISQSYVASFRTGTDVLVCMNSQSETAQVGAFVGNLTGATIQNCNSNIDVANLGLGGKNSTVYDDDVGVMPPVPSSVGIQILSNGMSADDGLDGYKVVYLELYESQIAGNQSIFDDMNKYNLGDFIDHELGDAGAEISSSDSSIIKIENDGIRLLSRGLCQLTISSRFNPYLKESVYVWVVGVNGGIAISQSNDDIEYSISDNSTISLRAEQLSTFDKDTTNIVFDGVSTVNGSSYDILIQNDKFVIANYENLFTLGLSNEYLKKIQNNEVEEFVEDLTLDGVYAIEIAGRRYVSSAFASKLIKVRIVAGMTSLNLSSQDIEMCANDQLKIGFSYESSLGNNDELFVSASKNAYINGEFVKFGKYEKVNSGKTSGEFMIELYDKSYHGKFTLLFTDKNKTFQKQITINVLPQNVEVVATRYFDSLPRDINLSNTTTLITPGKAGVLALDIIPNFADIDYVTITNASTNPSLVQFDFVDSNYRKITGATLIDGGIKIPRKYFLVGEKFGTILVKTIVETQVADNQPLTLIVGTSDGYQGTFVLTTKHTEKVVGKIDGRNSMTDVVLANGLDYQLNLTSVGFSADQVRVEATSNVVTISKISDFVFNIHANNVVSGSLTTLKIYGEKEVDGMQVKTQIQMISIVVKDYVVYEKVNFKDASEDSLNGQYDIVTGYVGIAKQLEIELINGVNCEYDISNSTIVYRLKNFEEQLNKNGTFSLEGWNAGETNDEFKSQSDNNKVVYPQKEMNAENSKTTFEFDCKIDGVTYSATMKMNVENISTSSSMIPITTVEEFMNMTEDNYYILLNDITLSSETFKPISTKIAGFDGNNKKIIISGYKNEEENSVNFGLFEEIAEDVIVQNVHIYFESFATTIISNDLNFGFIAATNNGVITNCFVEGNSAKIYVNELSSGKLKQIGAIVAKNNGFITNSRVEVAIISAYGDMAGIAVTNSGMISSCYVKGTTIINNSTSTDAMTAGIACENGSSAKIFGCFIEGGEFENGEIYCNDLVSIRANSKIAAFVFKNGGEINDSYANIHIRSGSVASGFVYENQQSGLIQNSFSLCLLQRNMSNNFAFVAVDPTGLVDTTAGSFSSCYFCKKINSWQNTLSQTSAGIICLETNEDFSNEETFQTFGLSSYLAPDKGVWVLRYGEYKTYQYPRLVSAENIITASKSLDSREIDAATGAVTYRYINMPDGSKNNPFIISNAKELEESILSTTKDNICLSYIRLVSNIDYQDSENGVELSGLNKVRFCGELDGNGLKISGVNINCDDRVDSAGYFATIGTNTKVGIVKNFTFIPEQLNFPNAYKTGAIAGTVLGSGIYNVSVKIANLTQTLVVKGKNFVGGIAGHVLNSSVFNSQIINCVSELNVNATALSQTSEEEMKNSTAIYLPTQAIININIAAISGGVVGFMQGGTMAYCRSSAQIVLGQISGGVVGALGASATMNKSTSTISDSSYIRSSFVAGGLVGLNYGDIIESTVIGNASNYFRNASVAPVALGGIVGMNYGNIKYFDKDDTKATISLDIDNIDTDYVGGVVGILRSGTIKNYAFEGNLRGCTCVGGIAGIVQSGAGVIEIKSCVVGKIASSDSTSGNTTTIQTYGSEKNYAAAICVNSGKRIIFSQNNICSNDVLFSRVWIGETDESVFEKRYSEVDKDVLLKTIILLEYAECSQSEASE